MNFLKLKDAANKLLEFMEKYDLDDYNETLVRKFLKELIYVIDTDEIDNVKKYQVYHILLSNPHPILNVSFVIHHLVHIQDKIL